MSNNFHRLENVDFDNFDFMPEFDFDGFFKKVDTTPKIVEEPGELHFFLGGLCIPQEQGLVSLFEWMPSGRKEVIPSIGILPLVLG